MTTMNRATYLHYKVDGNSVRTRSNSQCGFWSVSASAAYSSNSIVSISTWIRGNLRLLTSSLALVTKFTFETSVSFPGLLSLHLTLH